MAGGAARARSEQTLLAGRYRLAERLGEQSGSSEWKAVDEVLGRPVAVRLFAPGFARLGAVVAAARAASRLSDPRLVQIFDADDGPGCPYIVTEWPSGVRLDDLVARKPLRPERAAEIIAAAADALATAHAAGLVHLCLTPGSLWWNAPGEVKISGLGIAAAVTGVVAADPVLADTRGLARLLYAALTGYWPGTERTTLPAAPRCAGRPASPRRLCARIPPDIDGITCRALFGEAEGDRRPIFGPIQLAAELATVARPGTRPVLAAVPASAFAAPAFTGWRGPAPTGPAAATLTTLPSASAPVTPVPSLRPVTRAPPARPRRRATGRDASPRRSTGPVRRRARVSTAKVLRATAAMIALAAIAAGAWIVIGKLALHGNPVTAGSGARPPAAGKLAPRSATAFDPYGNGQGENNKLAPLAIDASAATAWHTDWYTSAGFGNLKPGTGLLLDMGRQVTIANARITLGATPGADLQLRVGVTAASLTDLRPVAHATDVGGQVDLRLAPPAHGRYVLIWFTRLPPDASGTFQASVYHVALTGQDSATSGAG